jgi:mono/diheme cytochrome c family protein
MNIAVRTVAAVAFVSVCAAPLAAQNSKLEQGAAVFSAQKCTMCHAFAGKGNPKGPLDKMIAKNKAEHIRQWLQDPEGMRAKTAATRTPAMKPMKLTADQIDALVAYLTAVKPAESADTER